MNHGRIEQIGTPNELYHKPATRFVAGFIGSPAMNFMPCRLEEVAGKPHIRLTDRIAFPLPAARAADTRASPGTRNCCWACGRNISPKPRRIRKSGSRLSMPYWM